MVGWRIRFCANRPSIKTYGNKIGIRQVPNRVWYHVAANGSLLMEVANQEQARLHASSRIWSCTRCTCISSNHFLRHNYIRTNRSSLCPCSLTRTFRYGFLSSPDCLELILRPSRASARCRLLSVDQEQKKDHNKKTFSSFMIWDIWHAYIQGSAKRRGLGCVNFLPGSA